MSQLYDRPVNQLIRDLVRERLSAPGSVLTRPDAIAWFADHYPKVRPGTVGAHLTKLATNEPTRLHYNYRPGDDDVLFKIQSGRYRLYDAATDPTPITAERAVGRQRIGTALPDEGPDEEEPKRGSEEFAYERDLRNYLSKNLSRLEPGLRLYEDDGITGIEFPVGGRYIDLLALSDRNEYVVIELKVSRGYDRVVGQLLRYIAWIERNQAEPGQRVRGIIVAREISEDLMLACSRLAEVSLFEYELQVEVRNVRLPER